MKNLFLISILFLAGAAVSGKSKIEDKERDIAFYKATHNWFTAWKLVSKGIYHIRKVRPVEFVFFDDKYVYSTSAVTIKRGVSVQGCDLMNLSLKWKKEIHHDSIRLPDNTIVPVGIMSFAGEIPSKKSKSFFVMPLPDYWKKSGIVSEELGLENLVIGVFIHEFSHSQQMQNFGKSMTVFETQNKFDVEFSDDIIQNVFAKDSAYSSVYNAEVNNMYQVSQKPTINKIVVKDALGLMMQRQDRYFGGQYKSFKKIDNFFLTMEGLGQYSMYLWLTNPRGGNIEKNKAIDGVRRGGRWWSQDEGFALFLVLDKLSPPAKWAGTMFGYKTENVIDLISEYL